MGAALLVGDVTSAWVWNPFLLVLVSALGLLWAWTLFSVVAGRPAGLPGPLAELDRVSPVLWVWLIVAAGVAFGIGRNLL